MQTKSPLQALLQLPQWLRLLRTLVQAPPHTRFGLAQVQTWFTQASIPMQARPQAPQLRAFEFRFTHEAPQRVSPSGQAATQPPRLHSWPAGQARPHMPQLAPSVCRSAQPEGHWVCSALHG